MTPFLSVREQARCYVTHGYRVVPIKARDKRPYLPEWEQLRISSSKIDEYFGDNDNVGIMTGAPSGNLVCVDLDSDIARQLANVFLPPTPAICGRGKSPTGHRFYRVERDAPGRKWKLSEADKKQFGFAHTVELLATGQQVVVGPSIHETGDIYHDLIGEPATVNFDDLVAACAKLDNAVRLKLGVVPAADNSERKPKQYSARPVEGTREEKLKRAAAYIAEIPPAISGQGGHAHTYKLAIKMVSFGLAPDDVYDLLSGWNATCAPQWSDKELWHKIDDAFAAAPDPMEDRPRNEHSAKNREYPGGNSVNCVDSVYASEEWSEPIPLSSGKVAEFPIDAIPVAVRGFIEQLAEFTQTPVDLAAGMWMAATGCILQKRFVVEPVRGWTEQLSLYFMGVMEPANRKSAVVAEIASPIRQWEAAEMDRLAPAIREAKSAAEVRAKQRSRLVDDAAKVKGGDDKTMLVREIKLLDEEIAANPVPLEPRLLADDITPENLATKMAENNGRLGVLTAEGDLFDIMGGRYSGKPNLGIYLKSHCGDEVRVDRGSRPSELIKSPALSLGFCVQPEVLRGLIAQKSFRGRGMLGRIHYSIPKSTLGRRKITPLEIDPRARADYAALMLGLLHIDTPQDDYGEWTARVIHLSHAATELFTQFRERIETRLGEFGDLATISDWAGKLPGAVARIAGLFHVVANAKNSKVPDTINEETMQAAIQVGDYFISHATAAFTIMGNDESTALAEHILRTIEKNQWHEFTRQQLHQIIRGRVKSPDDLDVPLKKLTDCGYLRRVAKDTQGPGRKPSPRFEVNPSILVNQF